MRKRFDYLFPALVVLAVAVVPLAWYWRLSQDIEREQDQAEQVSTQIQIAPVHLDTEGAYPSPTPIPTPEPEPEPEEDYSYIPLDKPLAEALVAACEEYSVPLPLALGVIEVESRFQADVISPEGCYGLMQLNPKYFPTDLSPKDNLRAGIEYLGSLLVKYGDTEAALTSYNAGYDTGSREYAGDVLEAAQRWEVCLQ